MRRGASAMTVSGVTGQTASRPDSGSRVIDEAKVDAARLGTFSRSPRSIEPRHIRRGAKRLAILADPNATAATNDCWPNLGLRGPGVFVAMRIVRWRLRRARRSVFCLAQGSGNSDHSPTVIGNLRVTGQLLPSG